MAETTSARPKRSRAGLLLFLALLAAASWFLMDWFTGAGGGSGRPLAYQPLPYVNYGLTPDYTRAGELVKTSNSLGFRGPEVEMPKPEGRYRIVCLGGSTTYSDSVNDDETYPRHLEDILRKARGDLDLEVINAGIPSYTTAESLANLAFRCLDLDPDAIVVYHAANDYRPRIYKNFDGAYFHYRKVWDGGFQNQEVGTLPELRGGINTLIQHPTPAENGSPFANARAATVDPYKRNLTSICGIAKAHGILPVLVSFAVDESKQGGSEEHGEFMREHNFAMRQVAEEQGAAFIDLAADMPIPGMFHDLVHMTAQGTLTKARLIAQDLLEHLPR